MILSRHSKVLVTGSNGMVGSAVTQAVKSSFDANLLTPDKNELNLLDLQQVNTYFKKHRPEYVFMIGAKVGGIIANKADPVGFLSENVRMELNLFEACHRNRVKKNLFLGSSCIYPRNCPQPMKESSLLTGAFEPTNEGYALAKVVGLKLARYYHEQYGMLTICPMPCNIYGTNDHFDLERAHVLSALVKRFVDAVDERKPSVTLWGTGMARREFIHVDDVAKALLFLMSNYDSPEIINLGTGKHISIRQLATLISQEVDYTGEIFWDATKPDGMPLKCLDISRLTEMGFNARITLEKGIQRTISEYRQLKKEKYNDT